MKKKIALLCFYLMLSCLEGFAEQTALLISRGTSKVFTGINAFENAYAAAYAGDSITLSAGNFYPPDGDITKSVFICGNGALGSSYDNTVFNYGITVRADNTEIVGISFNTSFSSITVNAHNVKIRHCYLTTLDFSSTTQMYARYNNTLIDQCCVKRIESLDYIGSISIYNTTIGSFEYNSLWGVNSNTSGSHIVNCVIYSSTELPKAIYENNIIEASRSYGLHEPSAFYSNLFYDYTIPKVSFPSGCKHSGDKYATYTDIFHGDTKYPAVAYDVPDGNDGLPVGISGGQGFTPRSYAASLSASIANTNIFGKPNGTIDVTAQTTGTCLCVWWNNDYAGRQVIAIDNETERKITRKESLTVPATARGKGPKKGVVTLNVAAMSSKGVVSAPVSADITYSLGPSLTASSYTLQEDEVVTLKWNCSSFTGSYDEHAVYYSLDGGPWILWNPNASYDSSLGSYATKFKGKRGSYRFLVTVRTYLNGEYVRTPLDDEWSVQVVFQSANQ